MRRRGKRRRRRDGTDKPGAAEATSGAPVVHWVGGPWQDAFLLVAIVLFAFVLRLIYVLEMRGNPLFDHPIMDELYHDQWARAIAAGETFVQGPYFRAPLYPAFLAGIYKLFGQGYLAPRIVQAVLGSLSCALLFLIGRSVFDRAIGAVAGFVAAGYWMLVYFDGELLIPSLVVFLDLLLIWLLLRSARAYAKLRYGLAGVVLGLSAIARPNILLFGPAIVIWLVVKHRKERFHAFVHVAYVTAGCLLVVLPITVRNYVVGKDVALIATQGGVNFYIGNNPRADGRTAIVPGTPGSWWGGYYATIERAEQACGRTLKPSEVSRYYYCEALDFIRHQPGEFLSLIILKLRLFWTRWEISNNKGIYFWTEQFTPVVRLLPLGFGVIAPLGIVGLALCRRREIELFPLWGFVLVYMVGVVLFFCTARYRVPVLPPLILLSVYAAFEGVRAVRHRRWKAFGCGLALLVLAAVFVNVPPETKPFRNDAFSYVRLGSVYEKQGKLDLAAENYRKALELAPFYLTARYDLGKLLRRWNRLDEAIAEFRRALEAPPIRLSTETDAKVAQVHFELGQALDEHGNYEEAAEHFRAAIGLDPNCYPGRVQFNLGVVLEKSGETEESLAAFVQAEAPLREQLRVEPGNRQLLYALGRALFAQGRYEESLAPLRRCLSVEANYLPALDCLSNALISTARYEEACELLRRATSLNQPWITSRLAFLLATCPDDGLRNGAEALKYARQVCPRVESCGPVALDILAAALAEAGLYDEAVDRARQALEQIRLSTQSKDNRLIEAITERLRLYEAGQAYRLPSS